MTLLRWQLGVGALFLLGGIVQAVTAVQHLVTPRIHGEAPFAWWAAAIAAINLAIGASLVIYAIRRRRGAPNA